MELNTAVHQTPTEELRQMEQMFDRLFPLCRSITGPGLRETLKIINEFMPLEQFAEQTGTKMFDWQVPEEWRIREAWLKGPRGEKIIDFKDHNLHVLNYSIPVNKQLSLEELKEHLYTAPHMPDAIPYVTSYYKRRWGFCLPQNQFDRLEPGEYHAYIDSELVDGEINYAHAVLPGQTKEEVLISSYVCHPSMANNELSGPITAAFLYQRLKQWPQRRFTYRFVLAPETIGAIAYLHRFGDHLKNSLHAGMILTCVGGGDPLSFKKTRRETSPIDMVVEHMFAKGNHKGRLREFTPINGSDERQYCSPGFNLPVGQMSRMLHSGYSGYHNSADTKEAMTIEALQDCVNQVEEILLALELDGYYINRYPYGEVKLDRHGLYPDMNNPQMWGYSSNQVVDARTQLNRVLIMLNYSDGLHSLREIADKCGCSILQLKPVVDILLNKGLIEGPFTHGKECGV